MDLNPTLCSINDQNVFSEVSWMQINVFLVDFCKITLKSNIQWFSKASVGKNLPKLKFSGGPFIPLLAFPRSDDFKGYTDDTVVEMGRCYRAQDSSQIFKCDAKHNISPWVQSRLQPICSLCWVSSTTAFEALHTWTWCANPFCSCLCLVMLWRQAFNYEWLYKVCCCC